VPTRKQRRRREKLQRHEYEYVIETEEGEEIPVESAREAREGGRDKDTKGEARKPAGRPVDRRGRVVPEPSFQRVFKRSAIFAPLIAIFIYWTSSDDPDFSVGQLVFTVALLLAFFMPFSYLVDVLVYRVSVRRQQRERSGRR
jgi:hypothetical protein